MKSPKYTLWKHVLHMLWNYSKQDWFEREINNLTVQRVSKITSEYVFLLFGLDVK